MTTEELASELDILAEHNAESALLREAAHALRRLGRVEEAAARALRVLELEFNECGECVGADVCTRCALSAALRAE